MLAKCRLPSIGGGTSFFRDICEISPRETARVPRAHFEPGDEIFRQGEAGEKFYIIEKGQAGVFGADEKGPILHLGPGEFFSEGEFARSDGRSYHVRAEQSLDVISVEYEPFQEFLRHLPRLRRLTSDADSCESIRSARLRSVVRKHPGLAQAKVGDAMTSPPPTLPLTGNFASAISHFQKIKQTAFVVVDDEYPLQGICTVTDLHNADCADCGHWRGRRCRRSWSIPSSQLLNPSRCRRR